MQTALVETNEKKVFSPSQLELIKSQIAKGASDSELAYFVGVCERTGLDPFQRQIYAIMRKDNGQSKLTIQTGIDGYRLIADRTGRYAGSDDPVFTYDDRHQLIKGTVTVYKLVGGVRCAFSASALMAEYRQQGPMWTKMPCTMLGKCAEALALRKAFPADLSGLYTTEEMMQADTPAEPAKVAGPELVSKKTLGAINSLIKELGWDAAKRNDWAVQVKERFHVSAPKELTQAAGEQLEAELDELLLNKDQGNDHA